MSDRQDALHSSRRLSPLSIASNPSANTPCQHDHIAPPHEIRPDEIVQAFEGWHHGYFAPQNAHPPSFVEPHAQPMRPSHSPTLQHSAYPTGSPASTTPSASTSVASPTTSQPLLRSYTPHGLDHAVEMQAPHLFHNGAEELLAQLAYPSLSRQGSSGLNWSAEMPLSMLIDQTSGDPRLEVVDGLPPRTVSPGLGESNSGLPPFGASRNFSDVAQAIDQDAPKMRLHKTPWQSLGDAKKSSRGVPEMSGWGQEPLELAMNRNSGQGFSDSGLGMPNPSALPLHTDRRAQLRMPRKPLWPSQPRGGPAMLNVGVSGPSDHLSQLAGMGSARMGPSIGGGDYVGMAEDCAWSDPATAMAPPQLKLRRNLLQRQPAHSGLQQAPHPSLQTAPPHGMDMRPYELTSPDPQMSLQHLDHTMRMQPDPSINPFFNPPDQPMDIQHGRSRSYTSGLHNPSYHPFSVSQLQPPSSPSSLPDGSAGRRSSTSSPNVPPGLEYDVEKVKPVAPPVSPTPSSATSLRPRRKYKVPMVPVPQLISRSDSKLSNPPTRPTSSTSIELPPLYPGSGQNPAPHPPLFSMSSSQALPSSRQQSLLPANPALFSSHSSQNYPSLNHPRYATHPSLQDNVTNPSPQYFPNPSSQTMSTNPSSILPHQGLPQPPSSQGATMQRMSSGTLPDQMPSTGAGHGLYRSMSESYSARSQAPSIYRTTSGGLGGSRPILTLPRAQNVSIVPWGELGPGTRSDIEHHLGLAPAAGIRPPGAAGDGDHFRWQAMQSQDSAEMDVHMQQEMHMQQEQEQEEQQQRARLQLVRPRASERTLVKRELGRD